jgi:transcription elongation factor GreB
MADWQMREKRPLRGPVREEAGPTLKNYITPAGLQRLKDEHLFLLSRERPAVVEVVAWAASNGDRSENADYLYGKRRLGQIDSRIRFLTKRIDAAAVVDPAAPRPGSAATRVFFGATVTYKDAAGLEHVVSIVGIDEVDLDRGYISWRSPLANALMKASPGDRVNLRAPAKTEHLEIIEVEYAPIPMEITADPRDAAIVSAMINIGTSLKQRIIAEGVETSAQLEFLRLHGCGEGQGSCVRLASRPGPGWMRVFL